MRHVDAKRSPGPGQWCVRPGGVGEGSEMRVKLGIESSERQTQLPFARRNVVGEGLWAGSETEPGAAGRSQVRASARVFPGRAGRFRFPARKGRGEALDHWKHPYSGQSHMQRRQSAAMRNLRARCILSGMARRLKKSLEREAQHQRAWASHPLGSGCIVTWLLVLSGSAREASDHCLF